MPLIRPEDQQRDRDVSQRLKSEVESLRQDLANEQSPLVIDTAEGGKPDAQERDWPRLHDCCVGELRGMFWIAPSGVHIVQQFGQ
jgi:hypothetical protein